MNIARVVPIVKNVCFGTKMVVRTTTAHCSAAPRLASIPKVNFSSTKRNAVVPNPKPTGLLGKFNVDSLQDKLPVNTDNTASVYLASVPPFTVEDKEAAAYLGVNNFYRHASNSGWQPSSFYMLQFRPNAEENIEQYVEQIKLEFYAKLPYGIVSEVDLDSQILGHLANVLETNAVECKALFFDKKNNPSSGVRPAELLFIVRTPGGFWNVSCHASYFDLVAHKDQLFGSLVKNLRVELNKSAKKSLTNPLMSTAMDSVISGSSTAKPVSATKSTSSLGTVPKPKKLKKRNKVTQKAVIGNLKIMPQQQEEDYSDVADFD